MTYEVVVQSSVLVRGLFVQVAPGCWAELGGPSEIDGKIRPIQFDRVESAKFMANKIPGAYVEKVELREAL